ncbi:MAG: rhodanese-like domain-containing protein [Burkholderiales bacterium]|nr:rhodanese-like domain-containing protein [Burkholderiales bacterium]
MSFRNIDAEALAQLQKTGEIRLIDVRTDAEVARGIIPGALHIPLHLIPVKMNEMDGSVPTVIYCQSGGRSGQACGFLSGKGWSDLSNLQGGIIAWVASGNALAQLG